MATQRLGDKISAITRKLGFEECGGCKRRHAALNKVDLDAPAYEVARGLAEALFNPPELNNAEDEENR